MPFPETEAEKQVAKILENKGVVEKPVPVTVYHPRISFFDEVNRWRRRLYPVLPPAMGAAANIILYYQVPTLYRLENAITILGVTSAAILVGTFIAEGISYYLADRNSNG